MGLLQDEVPMGAPTYNYEGRERAVVSLKRHGRVAQHLSQCLRLQVDPSQLLINDVGDLPSCDTGQECRFYAPPTFTTHP